MCVKTESLILSLLAIKNEKTTFFPPISLLRQGHLYCHTLKLKIGKMKKRGKRAQKTHHFKLAFSEQKTHAFQDSVSSIVTHFN